MTPNETSLSLYTEVTSEESAVISGGQVTRVNFDLNTYLFTVGAGAIFNGGLTTNVVNIAFNRSLFTAS